MSVLLVAGLGGLGAMLGWGLADFFAKVSIDKIGELQSLVWAHLVGTLSLGVMWLVELSTQRRAVALPNSSAWLGLLLFGGLQAVVYLLLYKGFGKGQVSVLSPVFASFSGVVALVSIVAFGERVAVLRAAALAVIFTGILLLSLQRSAIRVQLFAAPGFGEVLLATGCAAVWTLGWDRLVGGQDSISFAFFMYAFMTLSLYLVAKTQRVRLRSIDKSAWPLVVCIGVGEAIAYASLTWAYSRSPLTSVVALLSGAFSLPTIFLARAFLKERFSRLQALGAASVIGGIAILALR